ncbi:unannotated protein [freshwater metagenome]|uniref:Unannotated protein n=1 Tax=freshwater metagenome TaxID=449393 RepID=A0A6J7K1Q9_9ZZZZ
MPFRPSSQSVIVVMSDAIGEPMTAIMRMPTIVTETSGTTTVGMMPRTFLCTGIRLIASTTAPASRPAIRPPRKPALIDTASRPPTMPGTRPWRSAMP